MPVGAGLFVLSLALFPMRPGLAASLAAFDSANKRRQESRTAPAVSRGLRGEVGGALADGFRYLVGVVAYVVPAALIAGGAIVVLRPSIEMDVPITSANRCSRALSGAPLP